MKSSIIAVLLVVISVIKAPERVFVFSMDMVASNEKPGFTDFSGFAWGLVWTHKWMPGYGLANFSSLYKEGQELSKNSCGMTNVVSPMLTRIGKEKKCDLSAYVPNIVELSVKPKPVTPMLDLLNELKKQNKCVVGVTGQDTEHHRVYSKKMKDQHKVSLEDLFTARLTVPVVDEKLASQKEQAFVQVPEMSNVFSVTHEVKGKFDREYFEKLKQCIKEQIKSDVTIVYIDVHEKTLKIAQDVGFETIKIEKPQRGSEVIGLSKATIEEIELSLAKLKETLKNQYGVEL
jgi:hypothetical protein